MPEVGVLAGVVRSSIMTSLMTEVPSSKVPANQKLVPANQTLNRKTLSRLLLDSIENPTWRSPAELIQNCAWWCPQVLILASLESDDSHHSNDVIISTGGQQYAKLWAEVVDDGCSMESNTVDSVLFPFFVDEAKGRQQEDPDRQHPQPVHSPPFIHTNPLG